MHPSGGTYIGMIGCTNQNASNYSITRWTVNTFSLRTANTRHRGLSNSHPRKRQHSYYSCSTKDIEQLSSANPCLAYQVASNQHYGSSRSKHTIDTWILPSILIRQKLRGALCSLLTMRAQENRAGGLHPVHSKSIRQLPKRATANGYHCPHHKSYNMQPAGQTHPAKHRTILTLCTGAPRRNKKRSRVHSELPRPTANITDDRPALTQYWQSEQQRTTDQCHKQSFTIRRRAYPHSVLLVSRQHSCYAVDTDCIMHDTTIKLDHYMRVDDMRRVLVRDAKTSGRGGEEVFLEEKVLLLDSTAQVPPLQTNAQISIGGKGAADEEGPLPNSGHLNNLMIPPEDLAFKGVDSAVRLCSLSALPCGLWSSPHSATTGTTEALMERVGVRVSNE